MGWQIKTKDGAIYGPVDSETLNKWIQEKRVLDEDFVWMEDKKEWVIIKSVSQLRDLFKEGSVPPIKKQEAPKVNIPTPKDLSDTLYDDKKILTDQLIADAWRAMLAKGIWSIIGAIFLMAIVFMSSGVSNFIPFIGWVGQLLIQAAFMLGWAAYSLKIARRETVNVGSIFEGFKGRYILCALGAMLLTQILSALAGLVSFGIWGFYLTLAYMFSYFFIFDEDKGPWEGMKASFDATKGYKWRIISVQIVCMLLGILFLGVGLFVTMPLANIALASLYYRIRTGRISEKHLRTSAAEYLIVLIPFVIMIFVVMLMLLSMFKEKMPLLLPQIQNILNNLPKKI